MATLSLVLPEIAPPHLLSQPWSGPDVAIPVLGPAYRCCRLNVVPPIIEVAYNSRCKLPVTKILLGFCIWFVQWRVWFDFLEKPDTVECVFLMHYVTQSVFNGSIFCQHQAIFSNFSKFYLFFFMSQCFFLCVKSGTMSSIRGNVSIFCHHRAVFGDFSKFHLKFLIFLKQ